MSSRCDLSAYANVRARLTTHAIIGGKSVFSINGLRSPKSSVMYESAIPSSMGGSAHPTRMASSLK